MSNLDRRIHHLDHIAPCGCPYLVGAKVLRPANVDHLREGCPADADDPPAERRKIRAKVRRDRR